MNSRIGHGRGWDDNQQMLSWSCPPVEERTAHFIRWGIFVVASCSGAPAPAEAAEGYFPTRVCATFLTDDAKVLKPSKSSHGTKLNSPQ